MTYASSAAAALIAVFFIFSGAGERYRAFLAVSRFLHMGDVLGYEAVRAENAALKAALSSASAVAVAGAYDDATLIFADVFSAYPFAGRSSVRVSKGSLDGMRVGYPATFGGSVLVGQVTEVKNRTSVVRMVGSPDWQIPVRIGPRKVAGLLMGGTVPRVSMIAADKPVAEGDAIVAASDDLPYGLTIGSVRSVSAESEGGVFKEAAVTFSYDARDIAELAFMIWTPD